MKSEIENLPISLFRFEGLTLTIASENCAWRMAATGMLVAGPAGFGGGGGGTTGAEIIYLFSKS